MSRLFLATAIASLLLCMGCAGSGSPAYYRNRQYNNNRSSNYHSSSHSRGSGHGEHHHGDHHHKH